MFPDLRESVLAKLIDRFGDIEAPEVYRVALWILAEVGKAYRGVGCGVWGVGVWCGSGGGGELRRE
jgi:hypothetical protein